MTVEWDLIELFDDEMVVLMDYVFECYVRIVGLFGMFELCVEMVVVFSELGVDEIVCFIDFGLDDDIVFGGFAQLDELWWRCAVGLVVLEGEFDDGVDDGLDDGLDYGIVVQIGWYGVTHLQCTLLLVQVVVVGLGGIEVLVSLDELLLGGEVLLLVLVDWI